MSKKHSPNPKSPSKKPKRRSPLLDTDAGSVAPPPPAVQHPRVAQPPPAGPQPPSAVQHPRVAQPPSAGPQPPPAGPQPPSAVRDTRPVARPSKDRYRRNLPHIQAVERPVFLTFCTKDRRPLPESVRGLVLDHCLHDNGTKFQLHGLVVMPDHVHMIFSPLRDSNGTAYGFAEIVGGIKGASSHSANKALGRKGHLWQDESYDHVLRSEERLREAVEYVCNNPVRKGLVQCADDYLWIWREWIEGQAGPGSVAPPPSAVQSSTEHAQPRAAGPQ